MGEIQHPKSPKDDRLDHSQDAPFTEHTQRSPPSQISQFQVSDSSISNHSQPPSRSVSPSPQKFMHTRHIQRTIDNYSDSPTLDNSKQLYEEARMQSDEISTATQSTAPSECDSQDSERSANRLKPLEPKRRRTSSTRRPAGERDDGGCNLPSPRHLCCELRRSGKIPLGPHLQPQRILPLPISFDVPPGLQLGLRHQDRLVTSQRSVLKAEPRPPISFSLRKPSSQQPHFTFALVILITILYTLSNPTFIVQVSATPRPQLNSPYTSQGVTAASTSMNWWPYSQISVIVVPASTTYTAQNPIPPISLVVASTSSNTITSTEPSSIISTSSYTVGASHNSQVSSQPAGNSTAAPSSAAASNPPSQEPTEGQPVQINFLYFIPVGAVLGAMLGASVTVVLTRRCRKGNGDGYSHPFPEEGGISRFKDTRDEQERRWIENRQAYSEDDYETDSSSGAFSPSPKQTQRLPGRARLDSSEFSPDHTGLQGYAGAKTSVPISESFYDEALAENKALELNLSSDEEPPAPYAQLRGDSIRRALLRNINQESNRSLEEHENATVPLRMRQKTFSQSTRSSRIPPSEASPFSVSSPAQRILSPRQMQELFFIDHADPSRNQWVTAEKLLAEDEDSDEENTVKHAILHAGVNERRGNSQDRMPLVQSKGIPQSISALSTAVASRRLVKPTQEGSARPTQVLAVRERHEEGRADFKGREEMELSTVPGYGAAALPADALGRVADIISTSWSQRDVTSRYTSTTGFGSSVGFNGTQQVRKQPIQARTVRFGLQKEEDGIEHRLGFHP